MTLLTSFGRSLAIELHCVYTSKCVLNIRVKELIYTLKQPHRCCKDGGRRRDLFQQASHAVFKKKLYIQSCARLKEMVFSILYFYIKPRFQSRIILVQVLCIAHFQSE